MSELKFTEAKEKVREAEFDIRKILLTLAEELKPSNLDISVVGYVLNSFGDGKRVVDVIVKVKVEL